MEIKTVSPSILLKEGFSSVLPVTIGVSSLARIKMCLSLKKARKALSSSSFLLWSSVFKYESRREVVSDSNYFRFDSVTLLGKPA